MSMITTNYDTSGIIIGTGHKVLNDATVTFNGDLEAGAIVKYDTVTKKYLPAAFSDRTDIAGVVMRKYNRATLGDLFVDILVAGDVRKDKLSATGGALTEDMYSVLRVAGVYAHDVDQQSKYEDNPAF